MSLIVSCLLKYQDGQFTLEEPLFMTLSHRALIQGGGTSNIFLYSFLLMDYRMLL